MVPYEAWLAGAGEHARQTGLPLVTLSYAQSLDAAWPHSGASYCS